MFNSSQLSSPVQVMRVGNTHGNAHGNALWDEATMAALFLTILASPAICHRVRGRMHQKPEEEEWRQAQFCIYVAAAYLFGFWTNGHDWEQIVRVAFTTLVLCLTLTGMFLLANAYFRRVHRWMENLWNAFVHGFRQLIQAFTPGFGRLVLVGAIFYLLTVKFDTFVLNMAVVSGSFLLLICALL